MYVRKIFLTSLVASFLMVIGVEGTSKEKVDLTKVMSEPTLQSLRSDDFKDSFEETISMLIQLLESGSVYSAVWSVNVEPKI